MKSPAPLLLRALAALLMFVSGAATAATSEQTFVLEPGWNAIHVQVQPESDDIATVFAGLPIASVWRWRPNVAGAQYVRDPSEGLENLAGWFAWFPQPRPDAFLTNLFRIEGGTSYLVRLEGTQSRQVTLRGRPVFRPRAWQVNGFTLTGLPVAAQGAPSFAEFFQPSPEHAGQPIYTLGSNGRWQLVTSPSTTIVQPGRAYWIYTRGKSNYQGPMHVVLDQGESLEYSAALQEITVILRNYSRGTGSFQVERIGGENLPLLYRNEDPETGEIAWPQLRDRLFLDAPSNADIFLTLAIDRARFEDSRMEQVLAISDERGTRMELFAGGNTIQPFVEARAKRGIAKAAEDGYAGLWVGEIFVDKVSEAQQAGTTPMPTVREFTQRVMMHVDTAGRTRLLKDVIQMWEEGTVRPSAIDPSLNEVDQPGRYVLLTDKNLLGLYSGASMRDGKTVGLRYSTVAYDFEGEELEMEGDFGGNRSVQVAVVIEPDLPTNPFLHRYHPDHNNLDEQFLNYREEAYRVVRDMQFTFSAEPPEGSSGLGWGDTRVGGTFRESIVGLHRNPIFISGRFQLRRVSAVAVLNQ